MDNLAQELEPQVGNSVIERMEQVVEDNYTPHPFRNGVTEENVKSVLADYLAMSKAFPFIAAGAQRDLILDVIEKNSDVPEDMEVTSVVSNFLCWDETGGHHIVSKLGNPGLPKILNTKSTFHGNMLQNDLEKIFPEPIAPNFSEATQVYLRKLLNGLGATDPIVRAGMLAAFEMHAEHMITALWERLIELFGEKGQDLLYFKVHVGEDDPAEPYHVAMTQSMLNKIIGSGTDVEEKVERYLSSFSEGYALNYHWTKNLSEA